MNTFNVDTFALADIARRNGCKTIKSISEKLGVNRNLVSVVINGNKKPTSDFMYKFVAAYNVPADEAGKIFFAADLRNK